MPKSVKLFGDIIIFPFRMISTINKNRWPLIIKSIKSIL
jgi:hypothetical protein